MADINEFVTDAKRNRKAFLKPYQEAFETGSEKERAEIIIKLVKLCPDHLTESWIASEVVFWLDRQNETDIENLNCAFISKSDRVRIRPKDARTFSLVFKIDEMAKSEGISKFKACQRLATRNDVERWTQSEDDAEMQLWQRYHDHRKRNKRDLPWPYWGFDVTEDEKSWIVKGKGGVYHEIKGEKLPAWGTWEMKIPK